MKLSIIVPVYNVEVYLSECIDSIRGQRFRDFELILVNDCSPDRCGEICEIYAQEDDRIHVIHRTENGGLSAARNTGIEAATGDYITFVDSDDFIGKDFYARAMTLADRTEADVVEMPIEVHYNSPTRYCYGDMEKEDHSYTFPQSWIAWIEREGATHTYAVNKLYRRTMFKKQRFPVGRAFEDLYTVPRIMKRAKSITFCGTSTPDERYYYRFRQNSITTAAANRALCDAMSHHIPIISELAHTTFPISKESLAIHFLQVTNFYIDFLRSMNKQTETEESLQLEQRMYRRLLQLKPGCFRILSTSKGFRNKVKNLPLALFGLSIHGLLYSGRWVSYHKPTKQ